MARILKMQINIVLHQKAALWYIHACMHSCINTCMHAYMHATLKLPVWLAQLSTEVSSHLTKGR